jgi:hypothetical protein
MRLRRNMLDCSSSIQKIEDNFKEFWQKALITIERIRSSIAKVLHKLHKSITK